MRLRNILKNAYVFGNLGLAALINNMLLSRNMYIFQSFDKMVKYISKVYIEFIIHFRFRQNQIRKYNGLVGK